MLFSLTSNTKMELRYPIKKVFFDRITDLLTIEKDRGRKLRGKIMAAISSSGGGDLGENFWPPFSESAEYLGMKYLRYMHTYGGEINEAEPQNFAAAVNAGS